MNTTKKRRRAVIDRTLCVACGCCVKVCPKDALTIVGGMYAEVNGAACVGCGKCARECPASVITLSEVTA